MSFPAQTTTTPDLKEQLAQRNSRNDIPHHAAAAAGKIAGGEVWPVTERLGRILHGRAGLRRDGLSLDVVEHIADGRR